jgi:hypothetical protein
MGKRRGKVLPVEPAEIGQSGNTFHDSEIMICAVPEEGLRILFSIESIVLMNPLNRILLLSRRITRNETNAAINVARTETSLI